MSNPFGETPNRRGGGGVGTNFGISMPPDGRSTSVAPPSGKPSMRVPRGTIQGPPRNRQSSYVALAIFLFILMGCLWLLTHSTPKTPTLDTSPHSEAADRQKRAMKEVAGMFKPAATGGGGGGGGGGNDAEKEEGEVHHLPQQSADNNGSDSDKPTPVHHTNVEGDGSSELTIKDSSLLFGPLLSAAEPSLSQIEMFIKKRSVIHPYFKSGGGVVEGGGGAGHGGGRRAILLIPVNEAYVDFGMNLLCSLLSLKWSEEASSSPEKNGMGIGGGGAEDGKMSWLLGDRHMGFSFVAMDKPAHDTLRALNVPVLRDPDIPFITSKSATWADPKFHSLVCTKLIPVIRVLKLGIDVILSDADIVFMKHFVPLLRSVNFPVADGPSLSFLFSIGSCHKHLPNNLQMGEEKINTGFYYAKAEKGVISVLERALQFCRGSTLEGDQPAVNGIIKKDTEGGGHRGDYTYGFFDGCLFSNGCTYFKHLCANNTYNAKYDRQMGNSALSPDLRVLYPKDEPVMVHANFLVGKKTKVRHLEKYGLWDTKCMSSVFGYTPPATSAPQSTTTTIAH